MSGSQDRPDFALGDNLVYVDRGVIQTAKDEARVERRSMEVLVVLAKNAGEVVSRSTILGEVWGDQFVGEEVVSHAIWDLRRALADESSSDRKAIETVPRRGYKLALQPAWSPGAEELIREGATLENFVVGKVLGYGASGVVYRARDTELDREVALKFLSPELTRDPRAREDFRKEARFAAGLSHSNISTVFGISPLGSASFFIVSELHEGGTVAARLERGPLDVETALLVARDIARGLEAAHAGGVVHRDLKPANVLLTKDGRAVITDFGIARAVDEVHLRLTGKHCGTPAYRSPEEAQGEPPDHRSDLWSLGVMLYEMVSGHKPFAGHYEQAVVRSISEMDPTPIERFAPQIDERISQLLSRLLAKPLDERVQSAAEVVATLDEILRPNPVPAARRRPVRRLRQSAAVIGLIALGAALSWLAVAFRGDGGREFLLQHALAEGWSLELDDVDLGQQVAARDHYEELLEGVPSEPELLSAFARTQARLFEEREGSCDEECLLGLVGRLGRWTERSSEASAAMSLVLLELGRVEEAEDHACRAVDSHDGVTSLEDGCEPQELEMVSVLGNCDPRSGSPCAAYVARTALASVLIQQRRLDGAQALLISIPLATPRYSKALRELAYARWRSEDTQVATLLFQRVYEIDSSNVKALESLGPLYIVQGEYELAIERLLEATTIRKRNSLLGSSDPGALALAMSNLGTAYYFEGRYEASARAYRDAIEVDAALPDARAGLGDALWAQGNLIGADEEWLRALDVFEAEIDDIVLRTSGGANSTHYHERRAHRAVYLAKLGRTTRALEVVEDAVRARPHNWPIRVYRAHVAMILGDRETVLFTVGQALGRDELNHFLDDPLFAELREDQGFIDLLAGADP